MRAFWKTYFKLGLRAVGDDDVLYYNCMVGDTMWSIAGAIVLTRLMLPFVSFYTGNKQCVKTVSNLKISDRL